MLKIGRGLPERELTNEALEYLGWSAKKIEAKTGIFKRHIASETQGALDLAYDACEDLFSDPKIKREEIDYLLYCTQSPDYLLPNNVTLLHRRLGLEKKCASLEFNQGCSGYLYGLSLAKALILSHQASNVLLVTADTYSKYIHPDDRSNKTIFGDASTATLLTQNEVEKFGEFVFGTDGSGAVNLCVNNRGLSSRPLTQEGYENSLYMNGGEIFNFTLEAVPTAIKNVLEKNSVEYEDIDYFLFHQANRFMLKHLRQKLEIPPEKFPIYIKETGNTVSSTIPLLLDQMIKNGKLRGGEKLLLIGFGVGYSWGTTVIEY